MLVRGERFRVVSISSFRSSSSSQCRFTALLVCFASGCVIENGESAGAGVGRDCWVEEVMVVICGSHSRRMMAPVARGHDRRGGCGAWTAGTGMPNG